jgi:hypothetical protein
MSLFLLCSSGIEPDGYYVITTDTKHFIRDVSKEIQNRAMVFDPPYMKLLGAYAMGDSTTEQYVLDLITPAGSNLEEIVTALNEKSAKYVTSKEISSVISDILLEVYSEDIDDLKEGLEYLCYRTKSKLSEACDSVVKYPNSKGNIERLERILQLLKKGL